MKQHNTLRTNSTSTILAMTLVAVVLGTCPLANGKGKPEGGTGGPTPVCIEFRDQAGDGVQSDGAGSYCDGDADTTAEIPQGGGIQLQTNTKRNITDGRTPFLDFTHPDLQDNDPLVAMSPFLTGLPDHIFLSTRHFQNAQSVNVQLPVFNIPKGQTRAHGFYINIWVGDQKWVLMYGDFDFSRNPHATLVLITRLTDRAEGDADNSWLVEAPSVATWAVDSNGTLQKAGDLAELKKADATGALAGQLSVGHFRMPFAMIVTDDLSH